MARPGLPTTRNVRTDTRPARSVQGKVIWAPRIGLPHVEGPDARAVALFERAVAQLQRHDFTAALAGFEELEARFPNERALLDRVRVYLALCRRELARPGSRSPENVEERLTAATAAINDGNEAVAEQLLERVLAEVPDHEPAHYLMAVIHARRGAVHNALEALSRAIHLNADARVQARHDDDFEPLRGLDGFERLIAGSSAQSDTNRRL